MNNETENVIKRSPFKFPRYAKESMTAILIDKLLDNLRKGRFSNFFDYNEKWLTQYGLYGLYFLALSGLIAAVVFPIRYELNPYISSGLGIGWFLACVTIHYAAYKFLPALNRIIQETPTKLSSCALVDCLAVLFGIAGIISLVCGLGSVLIIGSFEPLLIGVFAFIFCEYILALCLNPQIINVAIGEKATAGQELVGVLSFCMKGILKMVPIIFGTGIIFGCIDMIQTFFMKVEYLPQIIEKVTRIGELASVALLPPVAYILFLVYYFVIDISDAVLSIPSKLEVLSKSEKT